MHDSIVLDMGEKDIINAKRLLMCVTFSVDIFTNIKTTVHLKLKKC